MLSSLLAVVVSSAGKIAGSSGSYALHKDRLQALREELRVQGTLEQTASTCVSRASLHCKVDDTMDGPALEDARMVNHKHDGRPDHEPLPGTSDMQLQDRAFGTTYTGHHDGMPNGALVAEEQAKGSILLKDVKVCHGDVVILRQISLVLPLGKRVAIIGPSGAGKTTLLETIIGLRPVTAGAITFRTADGDYNAKPSEVFSYVPAVSNAVILRNESWRFNLLLERPVASLLTLNSLAALDLSKPTSNDGHIDLYTERPPETVATVRQMSEELTKGAPNTDKIITDLLRSLKFPDVDLDALADRGLSQGETQRFLLARSFLSGLPAVFLDEAYSAISADQRHELWMQTLDRFKTVFYICHDGASLQEADVALFVMEGNVEVVDASPTSTHYWVQRMRKADREG